MNKNNLKLIMELIFIFILPLVFICFTSEIQLEREFTYDNQGNYETSADTKKLSFDNSIIKYSKVNIIYKENFDEYLPNEFWIASNNNNYGILDGNTLYLYNNYNVIYITFNKSTKTAYYQNSDTEQNISFSYVDTYENDNITYYKFINNQSLNLNREYNSYLYNFGYYEIDMNYKTIWGNIKELLIDNLDLNDNVLLDIVLCYTILWFIMFLIWHLLYGFLELLFHVIPSRWKEGNLR